MMKKISLYLLIGTLFFSVGCGEDDGNAEPVLPSISIDDLSIEEGDENNTVTLTVTVTGTNETNIVISYATVSGSAVANQDFISIAAGELIIAPGETSKTIDVRILGDDGEEEDEKFEVKLLNVLNATVTKDVGEITITNDDSTVNNGVLTIPTTGYTAPTTYPNKTLMWADEFQSATLSNDWTHEIGTGSNGWGNNELQYYRAENTSLVDGEYLVIEAKKQPFNGSAYTSSRLVTQGKQSFKHGRIDVRAALPKGRGLWPAIWMLGSNFNTTGWPSCGEIDIMELVGHQESTVHGTVHWEENGHASYGGSTTLSSGDFSDEFHVFSIEWDANAIRWYLDGTQYHVINVSSAGMTEFQEEFFFILNVAVGGNWPGSPDNTTTFSQHMIVDYVRVYQ